MNKDMDLNFEIFMIVLLVLAIVVVGNFLRDGESNYLEGAMLIVSFSYSLFLSLEKKTQATRVLLTRKTRKTDHLRYCCRGGMVLS
jgi:hypothetical protein